MSDELYINYLMERRIMRKTHAPDNLHKIYAKKYANWMIPFLKGHGIQEAPVLVCCNTLYKLPDYFSIEDKNFFLFDSYLYDYIYDLNFALLYSSNNEYLLNIFLKAYIECLCLNDDIDACYWYCETSLDVEMFKGQEDYRNKAVMYQLIELSDIQEAVILLHEASHYLFKNYNGKIKTSRCYQEASEIYFSYLNRQQYEFYNLKMINDPAYDLESFLEECYCDFESIQYVLKKNYNRADVNKEELFTQLFRSIISAYLLYYIMASQGKKDNTYNDYSMQQLTYRLGNAYSAILSFLVECEDINNIEILENVYECQVDEFIKCSKQFLEISRVLEEELIKEAIPEVADKYERIKEFLLLV